MFIQILLSLVLLAFPLSRVFAVSLEPQPFEVGGRRYCTLLIQRLQPIESPAKMREFLDILSPIDYIHGPFLAPLIESLHRMSSQDQAAVLHDLIERYDSAFAKDLDDSKSPPPPNVLSLKRLYQQIINEIHDPWGLWIKHSHDVSPKDLLDTILAARGASYRYVDILPVLKLLQESIKTVRSRGIKLNRITLAGSLPNGLARNGSDLDIVLDPVEQSWFYFHQELWKYSLELALSKSQSRLRTLQISKTQTVSTDALPFFKRTSRLMIEVHLDKIYLLVYESPHSDSGMFRIPLQ